MDLKPDSVLSTEYSTEYCTQQSTEWKILLLTTVDSKIEITDIFLKQEGKSNKEQRILQCGPRNCVENSLLALK